MRTRERVRIRPDIARGLVCAALAGGFFAAACGGGYSGSPTNQPPPSGGGGATVIAIAGDRGNQSFTPNPGPSGQDQMVTWRNNDNVVHRIVLNDGSVDTGDIGPGATSRALRMPAAGTNYHCSIHPGMIGSIMASGGDPPPPCQGMYC